MFYGSFGSDNLNYFCNFKLKDIFLTNLILVYVLIYFLFNFQQISLWQLWAITFSYVCSTLFLLAPVAKMLPENCPVEIWDKDMYQKLRFKAAFIYRKIVKIKYKVQRLFQYKLVYRNLIINTSESPFKKI